MNIKRDDPDQNDTITSKLVVVPDVGPFYDALHKMLNIANNRSNDNGADGYSILFQNKHIMAFILDQSSSGKKIRIVIALKQQVKSGPFGNAPLYDLFMHNNVFIKHLFKNEFSGSNYVKYIKNDILVIQQMYPISINTLYYAVGNDIGGAVIDTLIDDGFIVEGISFNSMLELKYWNETRDQHLKYYSIDSPYYRTFYQKITDSNVQLNNSINRNASNYNLDIGKYYNVSLQSLRTDNPLFSKGPGRSEWKSISMSPDTTNFVVNDKYCIYESTDFGLTWNFMNDVLIEKLSLHFSRLKMKNCITDRNGIKMFIFDNDLYVSTDRGNNWTIKKSFSFYNDNPVKSFIDMDSVMIVILRNNGVKDVYYCRDNYRYNTWYNLQEHESIPNEKIWFVLEHFDLLDYDSHRHVIPGSPLYPNYPVSSSLNKKGFFNVIDPWVNKYNTNDPNAISDASELSVGNSYFPSGVEIAISRFCGVATVVPSNGYILISHDYTRTWKEIPSAGQHKWTSVAISDLGQYQVAAYYDNSNSKGIIKSSNFGSTWTNITPVNNVSYDEMWTNLKISGGGNIIGISNEMINGKSSGGYIRMSNDYGLHFTTKN